MTASEIERAKLTAGWLNILGANAIAIGCLGPAATYFYGIAPINFSGRLIVVAAMFLVLGAVLHAVGRYLLKGLSP